ncbi:hypothetical protein BOX37_26440 [Nocardia mangyaensis]|uniref:DUF2795 domain-containing protein n=1 Tax=Nocardia mangyaensis TaxID=2213200 RepID=A0A1J0VXU4_9NOCA|nr:DUF2795 domain-containing protein [Nocardia mangyaensis]APE36883.1 hypothetical protein BOX37_26440 [Nocardia mangyaensis]
MTIIDAIGHLFAEPRTRQQILTAAIQEDVPGEILDVLEALPAHTFSHVRDLWSHLPDLPIGD